MAFPFAGLPPRPLSPPTKQIQAPREDRSNFRIVFCVDTRIYGKIGGGEGRRIVIELLRDTLVGSPPKCYRVREAVGTGGMTRVKVFFDTAAILNKCACLVYGRNMQRLHFEDKIRLKIDRIPRASMEVYWTIPVPSVLPLPLFYDMLTEVGEHYGGIAEVGFRPMSGDLSLGFVRFHQFDHSLHPSEISIPWNTIPGLLEVYQPHGFPHLDTSDEEKRKEVVIGLKTLGIWAVWMFVFGGWRLRVAPEMEHRMRGAASGVQGFYKRFFWGTDGNTRLRMMPWQAIYPDESAYSYLPTSTWDIPFDRHVKDSASDRAPSPSASELGYNGTNSVGPQAVQRSGTTELQVKLSQTRIAFKDDDMETDSGPAGPPPIFTDRRALPPAKWTAHTSDRQFGQPAWPHQPTVLAGPVPNPGPAQQPPPPPQSFPAPVIFPGQHPRAMAQPTATRHRQRSQSHG